MKHRTLLSIVTTLALSANALAQDPSVIRVNEFMASNQSTISDGDGAETDWIELYNPSGVAVPLTGCYLTDDAEDPTKWAFPASANATVPAGGYLLVFASGNATNEASYVDSLGYVHTSFKLSAVGEDVLLVAADGTTVISGYQDYPEQGTDVSYGRGSDDVDGFFTSPTPGAANGTAGNGYVADTKFDIKRGFYSSPFQVTITCSTPGAVIKYTTDCSSPSQSNGSVYTGPISITKTTVLRVMAYAPNYISTDIDTQTYIFLSDILSQPATKPTSLWPDPYTPTGGGGPGGGGGQQAIDYAMDTDITQSATYGSLVDDALLAIPTIAITTDLPNLFNSSTGIYANPGGEGDAWERPAAVEMFGPDGADYFHVNTGLRIRGGSSTSTRNPKHSFRIIMRSDYHDTKIAYPLFGDEGPAEFDKIDFRTAQNFSWNNSAPQYATWLDDPFSRDLMGDMGHPYTRGFFFHLYLDGVYWGLFQTEERPDAHFASAYLGGSDADYDVLKSDEDTGIIYAVDGTTDLYLQLWDQVSAGISTAADYMRIQGFNTDRTRNPAYTRYLDAENFIDYMLLVFFTGAIDMPLGPPNSNSMPRNLYAIINRDEPDGIKWIVHDNEWSLTRQHGVTLNRVTATLGSQLGLRQNFNPWWLHSVLKTNPEYLMQFADRVHRHFFNGGAMTPESCTARYQERVDEIELPIVAESARWGDYLSANSPRTRDVDWRGNIDWTLNSYFNATPSTRTAVVLGQLKAAGLYPTVDAPEFNVNGGDVESGFAAILTAPSGTIYYTTDGQDPRLVGGSILGTAASGASGLSIPVTSTTTIRARARNGSTWSAITEATFTPLTADPAPSGWIVN